MTCVYCGGVKRIQIVSPVSDHAWADCFCVKVQQAPPLSQPPEASEVGAVAIIRGIMEAAETQMVSTLYDDRGRSLWEACAEDCRAAIGILAHPPKPMQGLDEDWFADVLYDSLDMDWDVRAGAKAIMRALESRGKPDAYGLLNSARHIDVREKDADLITPPKAEASAGVMTLVQARRIVDAVTEHCRGADFSCDMKAATKSVLALAQPAPEQGEG